MKAAKQVMAITVAVVVLAFTSSHSSAQQVTDTLGSPDATTTISGKQLPPPAPKFGGVIKERACSHKWELKDEGMIWILEHKNFLRNLRSIAVSDTFGLIESLAPVRQKSP